MKKLLLFCGLMLMTALGWMLHAQCSYTLTLNDSYGDGWNGNSLSLVSNGTTIDNYTLEGGSTSTVEITITHGASYSLQWTQGSYASETSFTLTDALGTVIYSCPDGYNLSGGEIYSFVGNCSGCFPVMPDVVVVNENSATINWPSSLSEGATYEVSLGTSAGPDEMNTIPVSDTFYVFSNLSMQTTYFAYVRTVCDAAANDYSSWRSISFTTSQVPAQLPYICNFEDLNENALWGFANENQTNQWHIGMAANSTENGLYSCYISNDSGATNNYVDAQSAVYAYRDILFPPSDNDFLFSFKWKNQGENSMYEALRVFAGDVVDVQAGVGGTHVTIPGAEELGSFFNNNSWNEESFRLSAEEFAGTVKRIYFFFFTDAYVANNPPAAFDDIAIRELTCPDVDSVLVSDITTNSVTITPFAELSVNNFVLYYKSSSDSIYTQVGCSASGTTLTDLTPGTYYSFFVKTDCGNGDYGYPTEVEDFYTLCAPITSFPWSESFESEWFYEDGFVGTDDAPICWINFNYGSSVSSGWEHFSEGYTGMGSAAMYGGYYNDNSHTNNDWLVTPVMSLTGEQRLNFFVKKQSSAYSDDISIYAINVADEDITNFAQTASAVCLMPSTSVSTDWTEYEVSLQSCIGDYRLAFVRNTVPGGSYLLIDDVTISAQLACPNVFNVEANPATGTAISVNFSTSNSAGQGWEVAYAPTSTTPFDPASATVITIHDAALVPFVIENIPQGVPYTFAVRQACGGEWSDTVSCSTPSTPVTQVPFICGFEDTIQNALWSFIQTTETNKWYIGTATANGGSHSLYISNDNGAGNEYSNVNCSGVVAYVDVAFGQEEEYFLSFDWKGMGEANYDYMAVCLLPLNVDLSIPSDSWYDPEWVQNYKLSGDALMMSGNNNYETFSIVLNGAAVNNSIRRLAFYWKNDGGLSYAPAASVDNISITPITCGIPSQLVVSNVGVNEANLTWNSNADEWIVSYRAASSPWTHVYATETTFNFTELLPNTTYEAYVRSLCNGDTSHASDVVSFTTECLAQTVPFIEEFSSHVNYHLPNSCWSIGIGALNSIAILDYDITASMWNNQSEEMDLNMGHHFSCELYYDSKQWLVSPIIDLGDGSQTYQIELDAMLTGWEVSDAAGLECFDDEFAIALSFDNGATWHRSDAYIWSNTDGASRVLNDLAGEVNHIVIPLVDENNDPISGHIKVGFYAASSEYNSSSNFIRIDNFAVNPYSTCVRPENITADDIQATEVTLSWQNLDIAQGFQAIVVPFGTSIDNVTPIDIYDTTYTFTNLTPSTGYSFYLRSNCGDEQSSYATINLYTECAPINMLPFIENFDSYSANHFPMCWQRIGSSTWEGTFPATYTYNFTSSPNALRFYSPYNAVYALLPELDSTINVNSLRISFDMKVSGMPDLVVGVMNSIADSTFVPIDTVSQEGHYDINLNGYTGTGKYIAFKQLIGYGESFVDNIFVDFAPNCAEPQILEANNVMANSAELSWSSDDSVTSWQMVVSENFSTPDYANPSEISANPYLMENLTPNTTYTVYLRSVCPDGNSYSGWSSVTFSTMSDEIAETPYFHDFEDAEENANWVLVNGNQTNKWYIGAPEGDSVLFISQTGSEFSYGDVPSLVWAYRDIEFDPAAEYELSFKWKCAGEGSNYNSYDYFNVFIGTPAVVEASGTTIQAPVGASQLGGNFLNSPNWQNYSVMLDASIYAGTTQRLYFCWKNDGYASASPSAVIDSIRITASDCARPTNLTVSHVYSTTADLNFVPSQSTSIAWEYVITSTNEDPNTLTPVVIADTVFSITNLMPETTYKVYVRTDCGDSDYSEWSAYEEFTTLVACPAPIQTSVSAVTTTSATITWIEGGNATEWTVEYGTIGFTPGMGSSTVVTNNTLDLIGLAPATMYDVYIWANCSATEQSDSTKFTFATSCGIINSFPYTEGFEYDGAMSACWSQEFVVGTVSWNASNTTSSYSLNTPHSGSYFAHFSYGSSDGFSTRLVSPIFDLSQVSNPYLTYWYGLPNWAADVDNIEVYYRTSPTDSWHELVSHTTSTNAWVLDSLALPNPSATYQIAFKGIALYGHGVMIDDITIDAGATAEPCDAPTNVQVTPTANTADVTWTSTADAWVVEYKEATAENWTASATLTANNYNITGLTAATDYMVRVKAICDTDTESDWSAEVPFTTLAGEVTTYTITATATGPGTITPNGTITVTEGENVTFAFAANAGAVVDRLLVDDAETTIPANNEYTFSNVVANHTIAVEFVEETGIEEIDLNAAVVLYPNPATSQIQIQVADSRFLGAEMQIFDVYGKLISNATIETLSTQVDVSQLANGMYMVRINAAEGMVTKRFVKR